MGGALRWIINVAVPEALEQLGYRATDAVRLITFDSVTEVVKHSGHDPTIRNLRDIPVSGRGTRTLMAPAVAELGRTLATGGTYNVIVVSDGFVDDMDSTKSNAVAAALRVPHDARVAFAMIRFFNGHPPDTVALSMCGSLGTVGLAPVVDCEPPAQWECSVCTFLNPTIARKCEICETPSGHTAVAKDEGPLGTFIKAFAEAFSTQMLPHVKVTGCVSRLPRQPSTTVSCIEVPVGVDTFLQLDGANLVVDGKQCDFAERAVEGEAGLGLSGKLEGELDSYFHAVLAQLRLWVLAGTRSEAMHDVIDLCKRVLDTRSDQAAGGVGLMQRAWALRKSVERTESTLSRLAALATAEQFVQDLGSKQQGDFLRASSVATSDRLLARRALGPDIIYHDICRACLADTDIKTNNTDIRSPYGGSSYADVLRAAKCLSGAAKDLTAAEILMVIGGFGIPFVGAADSKDDAWTMRVQALDPTQYYPESDIWAAKSRREDIQLSTGVLATGVIPISACDPEAHRQYMTALRPVAILHLGAQLNGQLPVKPWGWANLFTNPAGGPPDHSHALCDGFLARAAAGMAYAAATYHGERHHTTRDEDTVTVHLAQEVARHGCNELPNSSPLFLTFVQALCNGDFAAAASLLHSDVCYPSLLKMVAAVFTSKAKGASPQNNYLMRAIYEAAVKLAFKQQGPLNNTQRRDMVIKLCCPNYEDKRTPVTPEALDKAYQIYQRNIEGCGLFDEEEEVEVRCCDDIYGPGEMRAQVANLKWADCNLPYGLYKVLCAPEAVSLSQVFIGETNTPEVAYVLASIVVNVIDGGKPLHGALNDVRFAEQYLKKRVAACAKDEYNERLQAQVNSRIISATSRVLELQRTYRAGVEQPGMIDVFQDPRTIAVMRLGRAPWAPPGCYTTTRRPRSF
eukprot:TRINITY_DN3073_c0_g1_i1.p1 TRINITY_DN3073_c0_g1~~TRINITY_DN3073_c0_g1_i1.p1  ORF type:complete len:1047 (+),score=224.84 TRINITY_DN3073_c0_g1_i1:407-3142(+)